MSLADDGEWDRLVETIQRHTGVSIAPYRTSVVRRRVRTWMVRRRIPNVQALIKALETHPQWAQDLIAYVTVSTSDFFRNRPVFNFLAQHCIVPWPRGQPLRVASVGCGRGQEVYSFACLCVVHRPQDLDWWVFGVDLDGPELQQARAGFFSNREVQALTERERAVLFVQDPSLGRLRVRPEIRTRVTFVMGNAFALPFQTATLDLVLLRNVLIFIEPDHHGKILDEAARVLRDGGWLVLGNVERLPSEQEGLWKRLSLTFHVYQKRGGC